MNRTSKIAIQLLVALWFGCQVYAASASEWVLNTEASSLSFVSTKNNSNTEVHRFDRWAASVANDGSAHLAVELDSVITGIALRDQRLREKLFETDVLPSALVSLDLPNTLIDQLPVGETQLRMLEFTLALHGRQQSLSARVQITKTAGHQLVINSLQPVIVDATDFDMLDGIQWLTEIAGLMDITTQVPVFFQLVLQDRAVVGGELVQPGVQPPSPVIHAVAMEGDKLRVSWGPGIDSDNDGVVDSLDAHPDNAKRVGDPGLQRELWLNIEARSLADHDFTRFASAVDVSENGRAFNNRANNYASRLRGYLVPKVSGEYRLYVAGDDEAVLFFSPDQHAANAEQVASVPSYTGRDEWQKFAQQQSTRVQLQAGHRYYIEAQGLERAGGDHLSIGWQKDDGNIEVVPGEMVETWQQGSRQVQAPEATDHYLVQYRAQGGDWVSLQSLDSSHTEYAFTPEYGGRVDLRVLARAGHQVAMSQTVQRLVDQLPVKNLPVNSLQLYWSFDEPSFQVKDLSGNGRYGANLNVDFVPSAVSGMAVKLDADNDVFRADFANFAPEAYTVSFWFKADENKRNGNFINAGNGSFRLYEVTEGEWRGGVNNELDSRQVTGTQWQPGEWHHWVVTYTDGVSQLFKDGELIQRRSHTHQPASWSRLGLEKMRGQVDELRVYSHAFNTAEAKHLYVYPTERIARDYNPDAPVDTGSMGGQALYTQHGCAACHGDKGDGQPMGVSLLSSLASAQFEQLVADTMPLGNSPACDLDCARDIAAYLRGLDQPDAGNNTPTPPADDPLPVVGDAEAASWAKALYKASHNLVARLPSTAELQQVENQGIAGFRSVVRDMLKEPAFIDRLREVYNDRFLTNKYLTAGNYNDVDRYLDNHGIEGGGKEWEQDLSGVTNAQKDRLRKLSLQALATEPVNLVAYVVAGNRPFTEVLTADYTVGNYYLQRAAGITSPTGFSQEDNGNELPASLSYRVDELQPFRFNLPHAGVLTTAAFMNRYPSTATNRNRHRARMVYEMFLDTDILSISGARPSADDVAGDIPTMTNPVCTGCHNVMDPVASVFKLWSNDSSYRRDSVNFNTWPTNDILPPGFNGTEMPFGEADAVQWLARELAADPRFARATVRTLFTPLTGHPLLDKPGTNADPAIAARYQLQEDSILWLANQFIADNYNLKKLVENLLVSDYFFGGSAVEGSALLLTPEQLHRKLLAVTGITWNDRNRFDWLYGLCCDNYQILYGGIDSNDVVERGRTGNAVMTAIQSRMAAEMACKAVPRDFYLAADQRVLFPGVALNQMPVDEEGAWLAGNEAPLRAAIVHLHWVLYGERIDSAHDDVDAALDLLKSVYETGSALRANNQVSNTLPGDCRVTNDPITLEPVGRVEHFYYDREFYTRAWMALLTHMFNDYRFLHH